MSDILYIDTDAALASLLDRRLTGGPLAADTEFLREKTFHARLCLVQLADDDWIACVDPLSGIDSRPLWQRLGDLELTLHAARQDLEVILSTAGRLPGMIFDTQVAAALVGYPAQIGYARLVKELLGVELPKHHTRTDWSRRPLKQAEIEYAADDVRFLAEIRAILTSRLERLGRLDWAVEDNAALLEPTLYEPSPQTAWQRLRNIARMDERSAGIAAALAQWREIEALRANRPRQWILRDAALLNIAQVSPVDPGSLAAIEGVPAGLVRRAGQDIIDVIRHAGPAPVLRRGAPTTAEKALVVRLTEVIRRAATQLEIEPEIIASQKELRQAVARSGGLRALSGWRGELVGDELRSLLADQESITAESRS